MVSCCSLCTASKILISWIIKYKQAWNKDSAAQSFALGCQQESNPNRASQVSCFNTVGENWSVTGTTTPNYVQSITGWFTQRESFNFETNSCTSAGICSFYTQVFRYAMQHVVSREYFVQDDDYPWIVSPFVIIAYL